MTASPGTPQPKHIGILVIHGIGEENAYGTLDQFGRGLYSYFRNEKNGPLYRMKTQWKERGSDPSHKQQSWIQAQICYERDHDADITGFPSAPERITVAEYYWSPVTKGKIKDVEVLTWLFRAALEPFATSAKTCRPWSPPVPAAWTPNSRPKRATISLCARCFAWFCSTRCSSVH